MKLKEVDYEISEELYATRCMLDMICNEYDEKLPKDVIESIERSIYLVDKHLGKNFEPKADIKDIKLVSRVTFDMDSLKIEKIVKNSKR